MPCRRSHRRSSVLRGVVRYPGGLRHNAVIDEWYLCRRSGTITEEHAHHNNSKKYINRLKKACKGIDYLVCVSKELTNFYAKEIPHTKSVYIPNGLDYTPDKLSKLNNKNLISVGRLSPEKNLIEILYIIHNLKIHLPIYILYVLFLPHYRHIKYK